MRLAQSFKLTDKDSVVLELFLSKEYDDTLKILSCSGNIWQSVNPNEQKTGNEAYPHYHPHAAQVSKEANISRKHAIDVCEKFVEKFKIFSYKHEFTRNRAEKTRHYYLKNDFTSFKILIKIILENYGFQERVDLINCSFLRQKINEDLIRKVLSEKNVRVSRSVDIVNWKESEVEVFFKNVYQERPSAIDFFPCSSFQDYARGAATDDDCHGVIARSGSFEYLHVFFPVRLVGKTVDSMLDEIIKLHNFSLDHVPDLKRYPSSILDYYNVEEYEQVILPLLALITASPRALNEFVNTDWSLRYVGRTPDYAPGGLGEYNYPFLFELIFTAVEDIIKTRSVMENGELADASVNPLVRTAIGETPILVIRLKSGYTLRYYARFNTFHEPNNKTPEHLAYKIKIQTIIEPYGGITNSPEKNSRTDIRDPLILFSGLREVNNPVSTYLRSKFSHRFNNLLKYIDLEKNIPGYQIETLITELNRVIIRNDLSKEEAFGPLLELDDPFCSLRTIPKIPDHLRWIEYDEITWKNFTLIVKAFPKAFNVISKKEFEKMREEMNPRRKKSVQRTSTSNS